MKIVSVFGASKVDKDSFLYKEGIKLGEFLSKKRYIVKNGGYQGLMEAVSIGVYKNSGTVIGITVEKFDQIRPKNPYLTKRVVCKNLYERLEKLIEGSDMVIALPGSIGTLNEIFMAVTVKYGGFKPNLKIYLIGKMYKEMIKCSFIDENFIDSVTIFKDVDEFMEKVDI